MKERKHSALYRYIERLQGERPWGAMLDAGTGVNSIRWVAGLSTTRWTAVTGSAGEADRARMTATFKASSDEILSEDAAVAAEYAKLLEAVEAAR